MNTHKNARLTYLRRREMVQDIVESGFSASQAAAKQGVSAVTARKGLGRYLADGDEEIPMLDIGSLARFPEHQRTVPKQIA